MNALIKTVTIVAVGTIVCAGVTIWLVLPSLRNLNALNRDLSDSKTEVDSLQKQILAYQNAESDLKKATDKQEIFDAILPKENMVNVIKQVEAALRSSNTTEVRLSINDPFLAAATGQPVTANPKDQGPVVAGLNGITLVPYELSFKNDYMGLVSAFSYLEHLPNFTEISSLQFTAVASTTTTAQEGQPAPHTGQINADINAVFFAQKNASTKN